MLGEKVKMARKDDRLILWVNESKREEGKAHSIHKEGISRFVKVYTK